MTEKIEGKKIGRREGEKTTTPAGDRSLLTLDRI
jgi:hypothetical protein